MRLGSKKRLGTTGGAGMCEKKARLGSSICGRVWNQDAARFDSWRMQTGFDGRSPSIAAGLC
ncbi:hypothetical protein Pyn_35246 [Prunus yedoensis var. nudiflora]|uniref:Uncharacterized protein n=1 Tax=Prunus yedoensis var. nudiflora TaxID=2094558 RepID=A0A314UVG2_PRUYE|nr:hypothetical protein Pyn_35246 [Prunus yedoensis var. nudiflora]